MSDDPFLDQFHVTVETQNINLDGTLTNGEYACVPVESIVMVLSINEVMIEVMLPVEAGLLRDRYLKTNFISKVMTDLQEGLEKALHKKYPEMF